MARRAFLSTTGSIGAQRWLRPYLGGAGICLTFHSVRDDDGRAFAPNRSLEVTPAFLSMAIDEFAAAGYEFVAIDDAASRISDRHVGRSAKRPFAVVTFDDGYRDNLEIAAPVLAAKGVPWTLFAVPAFLGGDGRMWWLELEAAVAALDRVEASTQEGDVSLDTRSVEGKYAAFLTLRRAMQRATTRERTTTANDLAKASGTDPRALVARTCADWSELRTALRDRDLTVGSHTATHPVLSRCDETEVPIEFASSRRALEHGLGTPVRHLAYPHGGAPSCGPREFDAASRSGYEAAWTTRPDHLRAGKENAFALPRVSMNGLFADAKFLRSVASGLPFIAGRSSFKAMR